MQLYFPKYSSFILWKQKIKSPTSISHSIQKAHAPSNQNLDCRVGVIFSTREEREEERDFGGWSAPYPGFHGRPVPLRADSDDGDNAPDPPRDIIGLRLAPLPDETSYGEPSQPSLEFINF